MCFLHWGKWVKSIFCKLCECNVFPQICEICCFNLVNIICFLKWVKSDFFKWMQCFFKLLKWENMFYWNCWNWTFKMSDIGFCKWVKHVHQTSEIITFFYKTHFARLIIPLQFHIYGIVFLKLKKLVSLLCHIYHMSRKKSLSLCSFENTHILKYN